jgi:hypothetical protein
LPAFQILQLGAGDQGDPVLLGDGLFQKVFDKRAIVGFQFVGV